MLRTRQKNNITDYYIEINQIVIHKNKKLKDGITKKLIMRINFMIRPINKGEMKLQLYLKDSHQKWKHLH